MEIKIKEKKTRIRLCVVGHGHLGKWHCDKASQLPGATLTHIVENFAPNKLLASERFPQAIVVNTIEETFGQVDAYILVMPTSLHTSFIKKLIPLQVPIFCEKPMSDSYHESLEIASMMEQYHYQQVFQVGHSERFHEAWEQLQQLPQFPLMLKGEMTLRLERVAPFKGRATDVDVVSDLMIHDMDILYLLLGKIPEKVKATGFKTVSSNWDYVQCECFYSHQQKATVIASRMDVIEKRELLLTSHLGHISVDLAALEIKTFLKTNVQVAASTEFTASSIKLQKRDHLLLEQMAFLKAIRNEGENPVTFATAHLMMKVLTAVQESLENHEEVYLV